MAILNDDILPLYITQLPQSFPERVASRVWAGTKRSEKPYPRNLRLLRLSGQAEHKEQSAKRGRNECYILTVAYCLLPIAFFHLITLSALASTFGGIVRPICLAVLRLMKNSNFVGCSTGRSAGFLPFRL